MELGLAVVELVLQDGAALLERADLRLEAADRVFQFLPRTESPVDATDTTVHHTRANKREANT